ncbi:trypsin-like serine protease [Marinomonas sp. TW1]|uniref:trypsin-like serine protease n=1 Tax=Marinomonas sp. TW1 TaxID=1561203 RepID=UPI0007AF3937|nr:trypsin-like serine protease [Marinomonas sp. TW1]KZN12683.1 hypothetical protein OA79_14575 [Marinomonas sp. TW1]
MQFNDQSKQQAITAFNGLNNNLKNTMMLSTVRLTKNNGFTGSGVLVKDADNIAGIVTAKHNLCICNGTATPDVWNETSAIDLMNNFLDGLNVGYGATSLGENPAHTQVLSLDNSDIEFRSGWGSWDYDLMFISFKKSDLPILTWMNSNNGDFIHYRNNQLGFYQQNQVNRAVFVMGFGDMLTAQGNQPNLSHNLQVRAATITDDARSVLRDQNPDVNFLSAISANASNNTSTAPGDSGGPMFCAHNGNLYLLGVTLGSNFRPNQMIADDPIVSNEATFLCRNGKLF